MPECIEQKSSSGIWIDDGPTTSILVVKDDDNEDEDWTSKICQSDGAGHVSGCVVLNEGIGVEEDEDDTFLFFFESFSSCCVSLFQPFFVVSSHAFPRVAATDTIVLNFFSSFSLAL